MVLPLPDGDGILSAFAAAREKGERDWACQIVQDRAIAEEVALKAAEHLSGIPGVSAPNPFKVAGCYAFWIRKLKPFRV
ncbi:MAG: hypothetical protein HQL40_04420, partial [Alphaproteobacteria bacterium]|nr:hypothetical protein [Alphaproteobacteria bacterium]